jgi:hypothetical protein
MRRAKRQDPEVVWRQAVRMRCEWVNIVHGSWRDKPFETIASETHGWPEPEELGPPWADLTRRDR